MEYASAVIRLADNSIGCLLSCARYHIIDYLYTKRRYLTPAYLQITSDEFLIQKKNILGHFQEV